MKTSLHSQLKSLAKKHNWADLKRTYAGELLGTLGLVRLGYQQGKRFSKDSHFDIGSIRESSPILSMFAVLFVTPNALHDELDEDTIIWLSDHVAKMNTQPLIELHSKIDKGIYDWADVADHVKAVFKELRIHTHLDNEVRRGLENYDTMDKSKQKEYVHALIKVAANALTDYSGVIKPKVLKEDGEAAGIPADTAPPTPDGITTSDQIAQNPKRLFKKGKMIQRRIKNFKFIKWQKPAKEDNNSV